MAQNPLLQGFIEGQTLRRQKAQDAANAAMQTQELEFRKSQEERLTAAAIEKSKEDAKYYELAVNQYKLDESKQAETERQHRAQEALSEARTKLQSELNQMKNITSVYNKLTSLGVPENEMQGHLFAWENYQHMQQQYGDNSPNQQAETPGQQTPYSIMRGQKGSGPMLNSAPSMNLSNPSSPGNTSLSNPLPLIAARIGAEKARTKHTELMDKYTEDIQRSKLYLQQAGINHLQSMDAAIKFRMGFETDKMRWEQGFKTKQLQQTKDFHDAKIALHKEANAMGQQRIMLSKDASTVAKLKAINQNANQYNTQARQLDTHIQKLRQERAQIETWNQQPPPPFVREGADPQLRMGYLRAYSQWKLHKDLAAKRLPEIGDDTKPETEIGYYARRRTEIGLDAAKFSHLFAQHTPIPGKGGKIDQKATDANIRAHALELKKAEHDYAHINNIQRPKNQVTAVITDEKNKLAPIILPKDLSKLSTKELLKRLSQKVH